MGLPKLDAQLICFDRVPRRKQSLGPIMGHAESLDNAKVDLEGRVLKGRGEAGSKACLLLIFAWWQQ